VSFGGSTSSCTPLLAAIQNGNLVKNLKKIVIFSCIWYEIVVTLFISLLIEVKNLLLTCNLRKTLRNHYACLVRRLVKVLAPDGLGNEVSCTL
jgi:cell shape-determining protein MreD